VSDDFDLQVTIMTIYKHKSEDYEQTKSLSKDPAVVLTDDDEVCKLRVRMHGTLQVF